MFSCNCLSIRNNNRSNIFITGHGVGWSSENGIWAGGKYIFHFSLHSYIRMKKKTCVHIDHAKYENDDKNVRQSLTKTEKNKKSVNDTVSTNKKYIYLYAQD